MNKQIKISRFINSIYKQDKKHTSLTYCDDNAVYNIICTLNWTKNQKDELIEKVNNFDLEIKALPKFSKKAAGAVFTKYFGDTKKHFYKNHLKLRAYRLNKLYDVKAPMLVTDNELELLITLLIINNYAAKDSLQTKVMEVLNENIKEE